MPRAEPGDLFRDRPEPGRVDARRPQLHPADTGPIGRPVRTGPPRREDGPSRPAGSRAERRHRAADRELRARAAPGPETAHGHGHGHTPAPPSGRRVRILIAALLLPCALGTLVGVVLLWPTGGLPPTTTGGQQPVRAEVIRL